MNVQNGEPVEFTKLADIKPAGFTNFNVKVIAYAQTPTITVPDKENKKVNKIYNFLAADETGSIKLVLWDEAGAAVAQGQVLELYNCFLKIHQGVVSLNMRKDSRIRLLHKYGLGIKWTRISDLSKKYHPEFDQNLQNNQHLGPPGPPILPGAPAINTEDRRNAVPDQPPQKRTRFHSNRNHPEQRDGPKRGSGRGRDRGGRGRGGKRR